jgi:hypothetical protein
VEPTHCTTLARLKTRRSSVKTLCTGTTIAVTGMSGHRSEHGQKIYKARTLVRRSLRLMVQLSALDELQAIAPTVIQVRRLRVAGPRLRSTVACELPAHRRSTALAAFLEVTEAARAATSE